MIQGFKQLLRDRRFVFLNVGACNTIFGYSIGLVLYYLFERMLHILLIGVITNIVCISFSFVTYKIFVFKTKGNWIGEYLKCYLVYGCSALFAVFTTWIFVDFMAIPYWIASALCILGTVAFSWFGHKNFTFKKNTND